MKYFGYILFPLLVYLVWGWVFSGIHTWMIPLTLISIFIFSVFCFKFAKKEDQLKVGILIVAPFWILLFVTDLTAGTYRSAWPYLFFIPLMVYFAKVYQLRRQVLIPIFSVGLSLFIGLFIHPNTWVLQKNNEPYKNEIFSGLEVVDSQQRKIHFDDSKITVLDFWTTSCGVCFEKFPEFEKYYLQFKDNPKVQFYSVNVPLERDKFLEVVQLADSLNYSFPTIYANFKEEIQNLGVHSYPHLLILKNGKVRYSGLLITDRFVFVNHIKSEINRLLEE